MRIESPLVIFILFRQQFHVDQYFDSEKRKRHFFDFNIAGLGSCYSLAMHSLFFFCPFLSLDVIFCALIEMEAHTIIPVSSLFRRA